jgi:type IV secretion system protein VirB6
MNEAAPITWLIGRINDIVSAGAGAAAGTISSTISPLASVCFGIYIILILVNYLRGAETEPVFDFAMRMASFAVIIGMGLNASTYTNNVMPIVTGLGTDLANAVSGGTDSSGVLDELALHYFKIIQDGYESANTYIFPLNIGPLILYGLKAICILIGLIPFLVAGAICVVIANVGSVLVAMVGPLFFAFLLFPATRQYFSAWVNTAFSYALIPLFVAVIASISMGISKEMFTASGASALTDTSLKIVFLAAMGNLTLLFLLKQVSSLASSLSAGGINAGMAGGIGSAARAIGTRQNVKAAAAVGRGARTAATSAATSLRNAFNSIRKAG